MAANANQEDRPAQPASTCWTAPFATQEITQVSNNMINATGREAEIATADTRMADQIARHLIAVGLARGLTHDEIVSALMPIFAEVRAEIDAGSTGGAR